LPFVRGFFDLEGGFFEAGFLEDAFVSEDFRAAVFLDLVADFAGFAGGSDACG
jgi:hypothetical protein